jgi:hypothetical protein
MARIRSIKPEFFTSLTIGSLSERARLAFIGIWTYVDDYGRAVDDPRLVKAAVFPLDDRITVKAVAEVIDELVAAGRLTRYEAGGRHYFVVANWNEHQKIDRRTASKLPPPPGEPSTNGHRTNSEDSTRMQRGLDEDSIHDLWIREQGEDQGAGIPGSGNCAVAPTTTNDEMLCGASSSVVEKAALVFGFAQATSSQKAIDDPPGYARGVARNVLAEQGERLRAYVAEHPSADAEAVAANVFKLDRWALIGARKAMS